MNKLFLLAFALVTACSGPSSDDVIAKERSESFLAFQTYVDHSFPGWTVTGIRQDDTTFGSDGSGRDQFYIVLNKGTDERVVFLIRAQFTGRDGEKVARIYKPVIMPTDRPEALDYEPDDSH